jgi:peptide/nickel transport system permease protein
MRANLFFALRNRKVVGGVSVIVAFLLLGLIAPLFTDHSPNDYVGPQAAPPSGEFWLGTTTSSSSTACVRRSSSACWAAGWPR